MCQIYLYTAIKFFSNLLYSFNFDLENLFLPDN